MQSDPNHECDGCARAERVRQFDQLADRYRLDASHDFRRSCAHGVLGGLLASAGAVWSGWAILESSAEVNRGLLVSTVFIVASAPFWWAAERSRRSAMENRRLQHHIKATEAYVSGFDPENRERMRAALAQRLFARNAEDNDPLRETTWPAVGQVG